MFGEYKNILISISAAILVIGGVVIAGDLTNNSIPSSTAIPYTFEDIYQKINNPAYTQTPTHDLGPGSYTTNDNTMYSLEDIYNSIPAYKTLDGSTTTIEAGIYATTTLTDIDTSISGLLPENIASGTTMFGVTGTYNCVVPE